MRGPLRSTSDYYRYDVVPDFPQKCLSGNLPCMHSRRRRKVLLCMQLRADVLDVLAELGALPPSGAHAGLTSWRAALPQGAPPAAGGAALFVWQQARSGHESGTLAPAPGTVARASVPAVVAGTGRASWARPWAPAARTTPAHAGAPAPAPASHGRASPAVAGMGKGSSGRAPGAERAARTAASAPAPQPESHGEAPALQAAAGRPALRMPWGAPAPTAEAGAGAPAVLGWPGAASHAAQPDPELSISIHPSPNISVSIHSPAASARAPAPSASGVFWPQYRPLKPAARPLRASASMAAPAPRPLVIYRPPPTYPPRQLPKATLPPYPGGQDPSSTLDATPHPKATLPPYRGQDPSSTLDAAPAPKATLPPYPEWPLKGTFPPYGGYGDYGSYGGYGRYGGAPPPKATLPPYPGAQDLSSTLDATPHPKATLPPYRGQDPSSTLEAAPAPKATFPPYRGWLPKGTFPPYGGYGDYGSYGGYGAYGGAPPPKATLPPFTPGGYGGYGAAAAGWASGSTGIADPASSPAGHAQGSVSAPAPRRRRRLMTTGSAGHGAPEAAPAHGEAAVVRPPALAVPPACFAPDLPRSVGASYGWRLMLWGGFWCM